MVAIHRSWVSVGERVSVNGFFVYLACGVSDELSNDGWDVDKRGSIVERAWACLVVCVGGC